MREELPFKSNQFDVVFANLSIHFFLIVIPKSLCWKLKEF
ncbi:MAG: class I SAM-dependent methyltransferase [Bacilli bacterium]|nr:class I SAM-dependent methyltransferase [Bacilli bacterium]